MNRLAVLLCALAVAVGLAVMSSYRGDTAPAVTPFELTTKTIFNDTLGTRASDTLFTDSLNVTGARAIYLTVFSNMVSTAGVLADSLAVPIAQTRLPGGQFSYIGGNSFVPATVTTPLTATTTVSNATRMAIGYHCEVTSGGTPVPLVADYMRWRMASSASLQRVNYVANIRANTGRITVIAYVWR